VFLVIFIAEEVDGVGAMGSGDTDKFAGKFDHVPKICLSQ
jgi:hypothetical protein